MNQTRVDALGGSFHQLFLDAWTLLLGDTRAAAKMGELTPDQCDEGILLLQDRKRRLHLERERNGFYLIRRTEFQKSVIDILKKEGALTGQEISEKTITSISRAKNILPEMVEAGLLVKHVGGGYGLPDKRDL